MSADRKKASKLWLLGGAFEAEPGATGELSEDEAGLTACATCGAPAASEPHAVPDPVPAAWLVCGVNSDGSLSLEHAAAWKEAAHDHINDAINEHDIKEAASWVVRPVYFGSAK